MALSEYERKMLEELEAQLSDEDPKFAQTLKPEVSSRAVQHRLSIQHIVLGTLAIVAGIAVLVTGVRIEFVPVGIVGLIVMFAGGWYISLGVTTAPVEGAARKSQGPKPGGRNDGVSRMQEFMARQAQEWEKRRREGGRQ